MRGTGFIDEPENPKHWSFEDSLRSRLVPMTSGDVDLRPYSMKRHDQLWTQSCVAQATVKAFEIKRVMEKGEESHVDLSRLAVYYLARELMFPQKTDIDGGTYIGNAFDVMRRWGCPAEADWPWVPTRINRSPSWLAMRKAYTSKIDSFYKIGGSGQGRVDHVVEALQAGNPVVFGTFVDKTWDLYKKGQVLQPVSKSDADASHATVLVGFKDGVFIGENSWGTDWGDDGFYLMSPDVLANGSVSRDFWVPQVGWETLKESV